MAPSSVKVWHHICTVHQQADTKRLCAGFISISEVWHPMYRFSLELWSWSSVLGVSLWQLYGIYCFLMLMIIRNEDFWTRWKTWMNMRQPHHIFFEQKQMWGTCLVGVCQGVRGSAEVKTDDLCQLCCQKPNWAMCVCWGAWLSLTTFEFQFASQVETVQKGIWNLGTRPMNAVELSWDGE